MLPRGVNYFQDCFWLGPMPQSCFIWSRKDLGLALMVQCLLSAQQNCSTTQTLLLPSYGSGYAPRAPLDDFECLLPLKNEDEEAMKAQRMPLVAY